MRRLRSNRAQLAQLFVLACTVVATQLMSADEDTYVSEWGPVIGAQLPDLVVKDPNGEEQSFDQLKGENGLVLVFVRSSDW